MKAVLSLLILIVLFDTAIAQQAKLSWLADAKSYLNGGCISVQDIEEDSDSTIVAVGYFERNVDFDPGRDTFNLTAVSGYDIFIAKYTVAGKLIYAYGFGGVANKLVESAYAVAIDKQGNSYITGTFGKTIDFDPGPGEALLSAPTSNEIFIVSFTANGKFRYAKNVADNNGMDAVQSGKSIAVDDNQNVYLAGTFSGKNIDFDPGESKALFSAKSSLNMFFAKYDKFGKYVYAKIISGNGKDEVNKILLDYNGNILMCGFLKSSQADFDAGTDTAIIEGGGQGYIFYSKYTNDGDYLFAHTIGDYYYCSANSMVVATDNSFVITGVFQGKNIDFDPGNGVHPLSTVYYSDVFIARYNANGLYTYAYSLGTSSYDHCYDIAIDKQNNFSVIGQLPYGNKIDFDPDPDSAYYIKGYTNYFLAVYSIDSKPITVKAIKTDVVDPKCLSINDNGEFITAGNNSGNLDTLLGNDDSLLTEYHMFVTRFDKKGNYKSSFSTKAYTSYNNASTNIVSSKTDDEGNIYVCGYFNGRYDFDPGPGTTYLESLNYSLSAFFAKYNKTGKLIFVKALTGGSMADMVIDKNQNIYFTGRYNGFDLDPSDKIFKIEKMKEGGYYISRYDKNGNFITATGEDFQNSNDNNVFNNIAIDNRNNICISGWFSYPLDFDPSSKIHKLKPVGNTDMFFARYDTLGNLLFIQTIGTTGSVCAAKNLKISPDDEFILSGIVSTAPADFDPGPQEKILHTNSQGVCGFVAKYTTSGQLEFAFDLEPSSGYYYLLDQPAINYDSSGNILVAGYFGGDVDFDPGDKIFTLPKGQLFFASYTKNGHLNFAKCIQNPPQFTSYDNNISSIASDKKNSIYLAGYFYTSAIDCDPDSISTAILRNENINNGNNSEIFLARYDSSGNYITCFNPNADSAFGTNFTADILITKDNGVVLTGSVTSKTDFDPSAKNVFLQPTSLYGNLFVAKYLQAGNFLIPDVPIATKNQENISENILAKQP